MMGDRDGQVSMPGTAPAVKGWSHSLLLVLYTATLEPQC